MSLTLLNKKFEALKAKEELIDQRYDPIRKYKHQHYNIDDLREDYHEDLENYGFTKESFKNKKEPELENLTEQAESQAKSIKFVRPMTALLSPTYKSPASQKAIPNPNKPRPITAPGFQMRVSNMVRIDETEEMVPIHYQTMQQSKYWRNTKKYDNGNSSIIRNHSAMKKLNLGSEFVEMNVEHEESKNKDFIEKRLVNSKLFTPTSKMYDRSTNKSERDLKQMTEGFYEHLSLIRHKFSQKPSPYSMSYLQADDRLSLILSKIGTQTNDQPVIVKTKPQGLRPQTAVQRNHFQKAHTDKHITIKTQNILIRGSQF